MSKERISLDMFLGFSDELKKIATTTTSTASSTAQVTKPVATSISKPKLPKLVAKPQQAPETSPVQDHIGSMKANPPPLVTM